MHHDACGLVFKGRPIDSLHLCVDDKEWVFYSHGFWEVDAISESVRQTFLAGRYSNPDANLTEVESPNYRSK